MKRLLHLLFVLPLSSLLTAQNRFPRPDFESGYQYPVAYFDIPNETLWTTIDLILLVLLMTLVAWAVVKKRTRTPIIITSIISVAYFGFFRSGCVCSIGAIQNVALALVDNTYSIPIAVLLFFILPIIFTILFGRVFCAGVCPFGALQELVNVKNYKLSKALTTALGLLPWLYLIFAILFAVTRSSFIICQFDPFIGIFRLGGDVGLIIFGALLLVASIFTGRPFCRFLCPYGALLSLFARVSIYRMTITDKCINCELCHNACPVDAIMPPYENKVAETRSQGVKRIIIYLVFVPLLAALGALLLHSVSDSLSRMNKDVRLLEMVVEYEKNPQVVQSLDLEAFYGQGRTQEDLENQVATIQSEFKLYSTIAGACIGLVLGFTLIGLSVKRSRKEYEINDADCVTCGKCFSYCPQNRVCNTSEKGII